MCAVRSDDGCWSRKLRCIACVFWTASIALGSSTYSQDRASQTLELRRVFVPQQDLPIIGPDHVPVNLNDLQNLLAKRVEKEQSAEKNAISNLEESFYVAEIVGTELVSFASRFRINSASDEQTLIPIEPCSLAIKTVDASSDVLSKYSSKEYRVLSADAFRSTLDGRFQVEIHGKSDLWFSWSSQGQVQFDSNRIRFQVDYPSCISNRMLLKLPPNWRVAESSSVATAIPDPWSVLQGEWPGLEKQSTQGENWWLLELSGNVHVRFEIDRTDSIPSSSFDARVSDEHIDYQVRSGTLEVLQTLSFDPRSWNAPSAIFSVPSGLHVESITLNDETVRWVANASDEAIEIYPAAKYLNSESRVQLKLRGLASYPSPSSNNSLPYFDLKRHFTSDGFVSLSIPADWDVSDLRYSEAPQYTRHDTGGQFANHQWQWRWNGRPPKIRVDAHPTMKKGVIHSLSRLTNERDGLDCTSWVSIDPRRSLTSILRMRLPAGWTLDSVQSLDRRCTANVERKATPDAGYYDITLTPPIQTQATIEIRSRAAWSAPERESNTSQNFFRGEKPFVFPDWDQRDEFWVEPVGRYKLEPNAILIQSVIAEVDVSDLHRSRLPRIGGVWLIRPTGSRMPELRFIGEQSPYNTQLETSLIPGLESFVAEYKLRCTPLAGAISSITVDLAKSQATNLRWRQKIVSENGSETWTSLESRSISVKGKKPKLAGLKTGDRLQVDIMLKSPTTETIEIEARAAIAEKSDPNIDASFSLPVITFPEAAQQIATILVDRRLSIEDQTDSSDFSPAGYSTLSTGFEGLKYVYDPIRVRQFAVKTRKLNTAPVWLSNVISRYEIYATGDQTLNVFARLHSEPTSSLSLTFPDEWLIRSARCNGHDLIVGPANDSDSRFVVWIPKFLKTQSGVDLEIIVDGPECPIKHRQKIQIPDWKADASIVSQQTEIWLPKSASLGQELRANSWFSRPSLAMKRLWPSVWWASLSPQKDTQLSQLIPSTVDDHWEEGAPETKPYLAWKSSSTSGEDSGPKRNVGQMVLVLNESAESENWLRVFFGLSIALCLSTLRASLLPVGFSLSVIILFVVHPDYLPAFQQFAMGWLFACILRLINSTFNIRPVADDVSKSMLSSVPNEVDQALAKQAPSHLSSLTRSVNTTPLLAIGLLSVVTFSMSRSRCDGEDLRESSRDRFDIIIPVDEQGEVTSNVVYVPEKLLQVLNGSSNKKEKLNSISSVQHEMSLVKSESGGHDARWVSRVELNITQLSQNVVLPLDSKLAELISLQVNGETVALGNRLQWDGKDLYWTPSKLGITMLEFTFAPRVRMEESGTESILVNLIPIPFSSLTIDSDGIVDLLTNAAGGMVVEPMGRSEIRLGPIKQFSARWRSQEQELKRAPPSVTTATEIALLGSQILAKTVFTKSMETIWPNQMEIECNVAWQPIDRQVGSYRIEEEIPTSSSSRRRYRLVRPDWTPASEVMNETLAMFWTVLTPPGNTINVPNLDISAVRITEAFLHVMQSEDAAWELDGTQGWEATPSKKSFDWQLRRDVSLLSYRRSNSAAIPFLKRVNQSDLVTVEAKTELQFDADQVDCKTVFRFANPSSLPAGTIVNLTSPQNVTHVLIDNRDTPFSLNEGFDKLTILPLAKNERVETIEIRAVQRFAQDERQTVPLQVIQGFPLSSHTIQATRLVGHHFTWFGVPPPTIRSTDPGSRPNTLESKAEGLFVPAWNWDLSMMNNETQLESKPNVVLPDRSIHGNWPQYNAVKSQGAHRGYGYVAMSRLSSHWTCSVIGRVEPNGLPIDGVLLELPAHLLSQFESKLKVFQFKSPETGRGLVYLFADEARNDEAFQFEFSTVVSGVDDQSTISVPDIQWLGSVDWSTWISVPPSVAGQDARWTWSGVRQEDRVALPEVLNKQIQPQINDGLLLAPTTQRPQVQLTRVATNQLSVDLSLVDHRLRTSHGTLERLRSSFWFVPRGHSSLSIQFPKNLDFLAAECNGQVVQHHLLADPSNATEDSVQLQLLSSSLPQRLLVYFNIRKSPESELFLPRIQNSLAAKTLVSSDFGLVTKAEFRAISQEEWISLESEAAWDVVEKAVSIVAEIPLRERLQWWDDWQKTNANAWRRTVLIRDQGKFDDVLKRRRAFCDRFQLPSIRLTKTRSDNLAFLESTALTHHYESLDSLTSAESQVIHLARISDKRVLAIRPLLLWLAILAMIGFAIQWSMYAFNRWHERLPRYLSYRPWWLWSILGVLGYCIVPSWWLGPFVLSMALFLAVRGAWQAHRFRQLAGG